MPDYTPQEWDTGDDFTAAQATAMSQQIDEEEEINEAQQAALSGKQAADSDLTALGGISTDGYAKRVSGVWTAVNEFPKRVVNVTLSSTPAIDVSVTDVAKILSMTTAITSLSSGLSGTPKNEQPLLIVFHSTLALAIAHGSSFIAGPAPLLTTTVPNKTHRELVVWDNVANKWVCHASHAAGY